MTAKELLGQPLGPYTIESILGSGGMAVVYRARAANDEMVALKVLFPPPDTGLELLARFQREARTAARLNHPAIVRVFDVGEASGRAYMAMTLVEGHSLTVRLAQTGRLDEAAAADIAWQIADALYYAHRQGVVHRDVKPSNILLTDDGRALLTDFGVAQALDDPALTRTGHTVGTPAYMAPEQATGADVDGRADLYSLGVVLYQMVTGRVPFQGSTPQVLHAHVYQPPPAPSTVAEVSPAVEAIILKALAKNVADRFQTGAALAQALTQLDDQTGEQQQVNLPPPATAKRPPYTRRWLAAGLVMLVMLIAAGAWWRLTLPGALSISLTMTPTPTATEPLQPTVTPTAPGLPFPAGSLLKGSGAGVFRLNDKGALQHFYDWPTFLAFGLVEKDIQTVDDAALANLPHSGELTRLLQSDAGEIFWVVNGRRWFIKRWQPVLAQSGYLGLPPSPADKVLLATLPLEITAEELPEGALVKIGDNFYRLFAGGRLRRFVNPALATVYGYKPADFVDIPDEVAYLYPGGPSLTPLLQAEGQPAVFLITDGKRRPMPADAEELWALGYGKTDLTQVPAEFLESFPLETPPTPTLSATPTAAPKPKLPTPTPAPAATVCPQPLDEALSVLTTLTLNEPLGCPRGAAVSSPAAWEPFEHGLLLWRSDLNLIYGVGPDAAWFITGDTWREGDLVTDPAIAPPNGLYQPQRGFGKVWRDRQGVRDALGWAKADEAGFTATIQEFTGGQVWYDASQSRFIILFNSRAYQIAP